MPIKSSAMKSFIPAAQLNEQVSGDLVSNKNQKK